MLLPQQRRELNLSAQMATIGKTRCAKLGCSPDHLAELVQLWGAEQFEAYGAQVELDSTRKTVTVSHDNDAQTISFPISHG